MKTYKVKIQISKEFVLLADDDDKGVSSGKRADEIKEQVRLHINGWDWSGAKVTTGNFPEEVDRSDVHENTIDFRA